MNYIYLLILIRTIFEGIRRSLIDTFFGRRINRHFIVTIEKRPNKVLRGGLIGSKSFLALGLRFQ